jgi:hypothetical protein
MDPGEVIVWTVRIGAHWTVPPRFDAETGQFSEGIGWVETVEYERIGTIWSVATSASSWWVVPEDDDPEPVVVRRAGKSHRGEYAEGQLFQSGECRNWRDGIRRAENVRKHGVYAVVDSEIVSRSWSAWSGDSHTRKTLKWHADQECPGAAGKPRWDGHEYATESDWDTWRIADVMIGRVQLASLGPFCPRCVMLEPAADAELVSA